MIDVDYELVREGVMKNTIPQEIKSYLKGKVVGKVFTPC